MKLQNFALLSALVVLSTNYAKADLLSINGSDSYTSAGSPVTGFTINFDPSANVGGTSTGIFSGFLDCIGCVTMAPSLTYTQGTPFTPTQIFSIVDNKSTATVTLTSINTLIGDVDVTGDAIVVIDGVTYYGTLGLTTQFGGDGVSDVTFSASTKVNPVPEPASLALFGSGLLGIVGAMRHKFKA